MKQEQIQDLNERIIILKQLQSLTNEAIKRVEQSINDATAELELLLDTVECLRDRLQTI